jgi:hypothetical protein
VTFTVTFSESVTGVDTGDFALTNGGGISGASVSGVAGSGSTRTVTVATGTGSGTIRLDVIDNNTIVDSGSLSLGGAGAGNGNYTNGQTYNIDKTAPSNPANRHSSDHSIGTSSTDKTITMAWTAATDNSGGSGVDGYAYLFNTSSTGSCDQGKDLEESATTVTSASLSNGSYYFHICTRDNVGNWSGAVSVGPYPIAASTPTNTGFRNCTSTSAQTSSSGDNNGFEASPLNACTDGSGYARDNNSGNSSSTSCTSSGKDRHVFSGYNISLPASAVVNGIEVRVDGWADSALGTRRFCVEVWNGSTWVGLKQGSSLSASSGGSQVFGSATDKWGLGSWTTSMVSNLRVRITSVSVARLPPRLGSRASQLHTLRTASASEPTVAGAQASLGSHRSTCLCPPRRSFIARPTGQADARPEGRF